MEWLKTVDWGYTGTMLQGIGAVIGAVAVIVASIIGSGTFRSWRRQQLIQRHMELAEKVLTLVIRAQDEITAVRSPLKTADELNKAEMNLKANGLEVGDFSREKWRSYSIAQVTHDRLNQYHQTWMELQEIKPLCIVYFGDAVSANIDLILHQVRIIGIDAVAYAQDTGVDADFSIKLLSTLSFGRPQGQADNLGDKVRGAVEDIQSQLLPLLRDVTSESNKAVNEILKTALEAGLRAAMPFWR